MMSGYRYKQMYTEIVNQLYYIAMVNMIYILYVVKMLFFRLVCEFNQPSDSRWKWSV